MFPQTLYNALDIFFGEVREEHLDSPRQASHCHAPLRYLLTRTQLPIQAYVPVDCMGLQDPGSPSLLQTVNTGWASSPRYDSEANALCRSSKGQALDLPNCTDSTHAITQPVMP